MNDFWDNIVPLAGIACLAFLIYGLGQVIFDETETDKVRFEKCIAADMQWVEGNCVK
jgi:hypothetical protein